MLALISSIPTTVREGFDVQDLPPRAVTLSEEQMSKVFGGDCKRGGGYCASKADCCQGYYCRYYGRLPLFPVCNAA